MITPVPPRNQSPLAQLITSPRTCTAMITTASLHPQRRCWNHPIPAVARAAPSRRKRSPTLSPKGASCLYAAGLRVQTRSRAVPCHNKVAAARHAMTAPKNKEDAYRGKSWRLVLDDKIEASVIAIHASHTLCRSPPGSIAAGVTTRKARRR